MNMSDSKKTYATQNAADTWFDQAGAYARREPAKAVVSAFGAGFLINMLPLGTLVAVAFALARPVLLVLGLLKVWELCPCKPQSKV